MAPFSEFLDPSEFGCRFCGGVDWPQACMAQDGSCQDQEMSVLAQVEDEETNEDEE